MAIDVTGDTDRDMVVHIEIDEGPLNLLNRQTLTRLRSAIESVPETAAVVTIQPAAGDPPSEVNGLTAGLDLTKAKEFDTTEAREFLGLLRDTIEAVRTMDSVTVCGCGNFALGAGLELAMACDFRIATSKAKLGLPEIDVGLVTGIHGGLLIELVGLQRAKSMIYSGEPVSGRQAATIGLVNEAVSAERYTAAIESTVDMLAGKSPLILRWQKEVFDTWRSVGVDHGIQTSRETIAACFDTHDQREGMEAFLEKRPPEFSGR